VLLRRYRDTSSSGLDPFDAAAAHLLPTLALGALPLPLAVLVSQEAGPGADHWRLKVEGTGQHVAVSARSPKTPVGVEGRW